MKKVDIFSSRDLRNHAGELLKDADRGVLSIITKHGHPMLLTLPFTPHLLHLGVNKALALYLYQNRLTSLAQSAKIAQIPIADFLDIVKETAINVVDYTPEEIESDLVAIQ